jgi:hypothetical protein
VIHLRQGYGGQFLRIGGGVVLASLVGLAATDPFMPPVAAIAAVAVLALAAWRAELALVAVVGLAPAGLLLAPNPARGAEMVAWAFLAGWLIRIDRPLASRPVPRALLIPAALYITCAVASWLALTVADAGGIDSAAVPRFILRAIGTDHLSATSPEPATSAMLLSVAGVALLLAGQALTATNRRLAGWLAGALTISLAALSVAAVASVLLRWQAQGYAGWFIARFGTIERVAVHVADVNAAGSQYVLALLAAIGLAAHHHGRRWLWGVLAAVMVPGLILTGSRSAALTAVVAGVGVFAVARGGWRPRLRTVVAGAVVLILLTATVGVVLAGGGNAQNNAARAMRLRMQFTETTARMVASSPIFGVGIGQYHGRSGEFMPAELRSLFGFENAHNYFAQQFAELGIAGGMLFVWLILAAVRAGWRRGDGLSWSSVGVLAGVVGYLLTCLTGHPLLVPEAALPFWPLLGAAAAVAPAGGVSRHARRLAVAAAILLLAVPVTLATATYRNSPGRQRGFYGFEQHPDGTTFQWITRHAVTYVEAEPGFLTLTLRAADAGLRPFELSTEVDGREVDRRVIPADRWTTVTLPVRPRPDSDGTTQRVDLRVSHTWERAQEAGETAPTGLMVQVRWSPAR